jgi:hypothetical protein
MRFFTFDLPATTCRSLPILFFINFKSLYFMNDTFFNLRRATQLMIAVCSFVLFFTACDDEGNNKGVVPHDPNQPVVLTSFMPDSGRISEMVLLDGSNFGSDPAGIKVFFNAKEARVIGTTGNRILALVPRLPGDTCILSVEVGGRTYTYPGFFRYKIAASVTTLAGDGTNALTTTSLDKSQLRPVYIGTDKDFNIFVTAENSSSLLKLNVDDNSIIVLANSSQGMSPRFQPNAHPETNVIMMGGESAGNRDRFITLDPKEGWAPKMRFIRNWTSNGFDLPLGGPTSDAGNHESHHHCLYCKTDGYLYTRYSGGQLVKIDPKTWDAEIIFQTNSGIAYAMAFHPIRTSELWIGYSHNEGGAYANSLCVLDVTDPENTFRKVSGATNGGHRDGRLDQAQFYSMRQMNFDSDGNLFVGDNGNHCIRKVDTENMMVETIIGIPGTRGFKDGAKDDALFNEPHGIATDADGIIYVSDYNNNRVRRIAIE